MIKLVGEQGAWILFLYLLFFCETLSRPPTKRICKKWEPPS